MNNDLYAIALDVGGTSVKQALVSERGIIFPPSVREAPINSKGSAVEIIDTFTDSILHGFHIADMNDLDVAGIGIGMPGPFDYPAGISLISGVDKYEAIYGVNLRDEFRSALELGSDFPIVFENDAWSFVRGEAWTGAGKGFQRLIGLTLGTGFGSGFMVDDEIVESGPGVPPLAWIGGLKYNDGILDDRISRRGLIRRYQELSARGEGIDVKDIAGLAHADDAHALQVFAETGEILGRYLAPVVKEFGAQAIVIGGKIARSAELFLPALENSLNMDVAVRIAAHIDHSALSGAARFLFKQLKKD